MSIKTMYLVTYNLTAMVFWVITLLTAASHILSKSESDQPIFPFSLKGDQDYFDSISIPLKIAQTMAVLEIAHSM